MFERAERELTSYRRLPGQSIGTYLASMKRLKAQYTRVDPDSFISDKAWGQRLLQKASLTRKERLDVYYSAGASFNAAAIESALRHRCSLTHEEERRLPLEGDCGSGQPFQGGKEELAEDAMSHRPCPPSASLDRKTCLRPFYGGSAYSTGAFPEGRDWAGQGCWGEEARWTSSGPDSRLWLPKAKPAVFEHLIWVSNPAWALCSCDVKNVLYFSERHGILVSDAPHTEVFTTAHPFMTGQVILDSGCRTAVVGPSELAQWKVCFNFATKSLDILGERHAMTLTHTRHPSLFILDFSEGDPEESGHHGAVPGATTQPSQPCLRNKWCEV